MAGVVQDITGRKKIETALVEKERLLADSQAIAHIGSWMLEIPSNRMAWSKETFNLFGLSPDTDPIPTFDHFFILLHGDDRIAVQAWIENCVAGKNTSCLEFRTRNINGKHRWLLAYGQLEKDAQGKPLQMIGTFQDITDSKAIALEKQQWLDAFQYCAHGIAIGDSATNRLNYCNQAFAIMEGYDDPKELEGLPILSLYPPELHGQIRKKLIELDLIGKITYESQHRRKNGTTFDVQLDLVSVRNSNNNILYRVATVQDITIRKQGEAVLERYQDHLEQLVEERTTELQVARQQAEHLAVVKSNFLANMSHEIRSPMNAVLGFCYLLEQRRLDNETRQFVQKIHTAGNSLLALINDILDFSKIESGHLSIEHVPFRMSGILDQLAALMSATAKNKNLELIINPSPVEVECLIGDSLRLQQVLINLVSNAIKFTEQGEVELSIRIQKEQNNQVNLRFAVRDTGMGISPEHQVDIFSAFT
jgi:PAS domain S-box-containing protein